MTRYIGKRLLLAVPTLLGISVITFVLIFYLPADPARMFAGPSATPEVVASIRQQLGLDDPFWVQYWRYLVRMVQGDLGFSFKLHMPVTSAIISRLPHTLILIVAAIFAQLIIGLPVGIASALKPRSFLDRGAMLLALFGVSAPPFWLGLTFLYLLAYKLGWFPLHGTGTAMHLVLPAMTAGLGGAAWYARMVRSSTSEVLRADYIRTARAKGLGGAKTLLKHVMRNAMGPIVTMVGMDIPWFLGNIVLVETVFGWPGMGRLAVDAIQSVDVPLILGTVTITSYIVVITSILTDIALAILDPRVKFS